MRTLILCLGLAFSACVPMAVEGRPDAPAAPNRAFADPSAADRAAGADRFPVQVKGRWGYIDRRGQLAVTPQYDAARPFHEGRAAVQMADGWGFVDPAGRVAVALVWDEASDFAGGRARVALQSGSGLRDGFVDAEGAIVVPAETFGAYDFGGGLAPVRRLSRFTPFGLRLLAPLATLDLGPWTLVGPDGLPRATLDAESVVTGSALPDGRVLFPVAVTVGLTRARRWGFADAEGELAIAPRFQAAGRFAEGLAPVALDGAFGFVDADGAVQITPRYDVAASFSDGRARVLQNGLWGFVRPDGTWAAEPVWDAALDASDGRAAVQRDSLWGYLGPDGALALPLRYAFAAPFRNGLAMVRDAEGLAYIDTQGAVVWRGE